MQWQQSGGHVGALAAGKEERLRLDKAPLFRGLDVHCGALKMFLLFWCFPPSLPSAPPSVRRPSFPSSFVRAKRRRRRRRWAEEGGGRRRTRPRSPRRYERARAQTDVTFTHRVTRPRLRERIRDKRSDFYFRLRLCRPRDHGHFNDICTWVVILRVRRASERPLPLP